MCVINSISQARIRPSLSADCGMCLGRWLRYIRKCKIQYTHTHTHAARAECHSGMVCMHIALINIRVYVSHSNGVLIKVRLKWTCRQYWLLAYAKRRQQQRQKKGTNNHIKADNNWHMAGACKWPNHDLARGAISSVYSIRFLLSWRHKRITWAHIICSATHTHTHTSDRRHRCWLCC